MENTHRFAIWQDAKDIIILLWKLGSLCIDQMNTLLYGTDYKHGHLFHPGTDKQKYEDQKKYMLTLMMDLAQEIGATQEDIHQAWDAAIQERKEGAQFAQENEKYWKK